KGFGGHFHNDNSVAVFRDIPGIILACPTGGAEAVRMMRESIRLAREEGRVVIFLEPIELYGTKDLYQPGDELMSAVFDKTEGEAEFGVANVIGDGKDLTIITYGNGTFLSQRAVRTLNKNNINVRIIDLRWLSPLPMTSVIEALGERTNVLIVDECRKSGSPSEEIIAEFVDRGCDLNLARITGVDTFIPLGPAADEVLVSEQGIVSAALKLTGKS
ncbi:MAG: hypothetical protein JKX88_04220, partial [Marinicaulis sp.]|nr:hypothetical protein [Marinicaulis sp.]